MSSIQFILLILLLKSFISIALINVFYNNRKNDTKITFWHDYTQYLFCDLQNLEWLGKPNHYAVVSTSWYLLSHYKNRSTLECLTEVSRRNILFLLNSESERLFANKIYPEANSLLFPNSAFIHYEDFTVGNESIVHNKIDPIMVLNSKGSVFHRAIQVYFLLINHQY